MVLIALENRWGLLEASYMSSMSQISGTDTINGSSTLEYEEFPLGDNVGGVGGRNHTRHLVNHLANLPLKSISQHLFAMKP